MNTRNLAVLATTLMTCVLLPAPRALAAESTDLAQKVKASIEALRLESVKVRRQAEITAEDLNRLQSENVDLREQFAKFTAELAKMEEQGKVARERANTMGKQGQAFFQAWEQQIGAIANTKIREQAQARYAKRAKSYQKILTAMAEVREVAPAFLSYLNDLKTLFGSELSRESVQSAQQLIQQANLSGSDVVEALKDVETELDRVAAELGKYK